MSIHTAVMFLLKGPVGISFTPPVGSLDIARTASSTLKSEVMAHFAFGVQGRNVVVNAHK
jgi:hypothetical protein